MKLGVLFAVAMLLAAGCRSVAEPGDWPVEDRDSGLPDDLNDPGESPIGDPVDDPDTAEDEDSSAEDTDTGPPTSGSTWCWTIAPKGGGQLAVLWVDIDTGYWFEWGAYGEDVPSSFHTAGLALFDNSLVMAGYDGNDFSWTELDFETEEVTIGNDAGHAVAVASDGTRLAVLCDDVSVYDGFCYFGSFAALDAGVIGETVLASPHASRIALADGRAYTAWHSTNEIDVYDAGSGAALDTIYLEGWDTWIHGISVVGDELHLLNHPGPPGLHIAKFDRLSGDLLAEVSIATPAYTHSASGLWCEAH